MNSNQLAATFRPLALVGCLLASQSCALMARSQEIHFDTGVAPTPARAPHVGLDTDSVTVEAGKPGWVELRFHVEPGFHINSHTPADETLIPTTLQLTPAPDLRLLQTEFPAGTPFHLAIGSGGTLSTYGGSFNVRLQLTVPAKGVMTLAGKLHYQACDNASCFPARDLPVRVAINVR